MVLSFLDEEKLLKKYDLLIWKQVHRFAKGKRPSSRYDLGDLYQEASMAFLDHLRKRANGDDIVFFPKRDILNRLCAYSIATKPLSYPKGRTADINKAYLNEDNGSTSPTHKVSKVGTPMAMRNLSIDFVIDKIAVEQFMETLNEIDQSIIYFREQGLSISDISLRLNVTRPTVYERLKKLKERHGNFFAA